ncbi:hypothetical protein C0992_004892, partial [Termitomyces sp. T32_za158]
MVRAQRALLATGNKDSEAAMELLFAHTEGPELSGTTDVPVRYRLKAFVLHKGPSTHSGHCVAHARVSVRVGETLKEEWAFCNNEKVLKVDEESVKELKPLPGECAHTVSTSPGLHGHPVVYSFAFP